MSYEPSEDSPSVETPIEAERAGETLGDAPVIAVAANPTRQPRAMGVLCIALLLLGMVGGLTGVSSFVFALLGPALQEMTIPFQQGLPPESQKQQKLLNAATQEIAQRYRTVNLVLALAHMAVAAGLVYGAVLGLKKSRRAVGVLSMVCLAAIAFELAGVAPTIMMQREMSQVMAERFPSMFTSVQGKKAPPNAPDFSKFMKLFIQVYMLVILVCMLGWIALKVVLYGFVVSYVRRPQVKAALE